MASIVLNLDTRSRSELSQIRIRISHNHTAAFVATGVYVRANEFTGNIDAPVVRNTEMYDEKCFIIRNLVNKYQNVMFDLSRNGEIDSATATDIRDLMTGKKQSCGRTRVTLVEYLNKYKEDRNTDQYKRSFDYTITLIEEYCYAKNISKNIKLADVTFNFLDGLEKYLIKTNRAIGTRNICMRNIRAAYNDAMKRGYVDQDKYPFENFKIRNKKRGSVEYLDFDKMRQFLSLDLTNQQGEETLTRARDIFMICFYLCGANLRDVYEMGCQPTDEVVFQRKKIIRFEPDPVRIKKNARLQELIGKYGGREHLFSFCEGKGSFSTFQRNLSDRLERISDLLGFRINLSICRHTWATLCHKLGVEVYVISRSMGHVDDDVTTKFYVEYDWSLTAAANDRVIDSVWDGVVKNSVHVNKTIRRK